jgi:hypothetical protein
MRSAIKLATIAALCVAAAGMSLRLLAMAIHRNPRVVLQDSVTADADRFAPLRHDVSPGAIVGYVSDTPVEIANPKAPGNQELYAAQLALAPAVVASDTRERLIVGRFATGEAGRAFAAARGWRIGDDLGDGVFLFVNPARSAPGARHSD